MVVSNTVSKQYHGKFLALLVNIYIYIFFFIFHFHDILLCSHLTAIPITHFSSFISPTYTEGPESVKRRNGTFLSVLVVFLCFRFPRYFDSLVHAVARYCVLNILVAFVLAGLRAIKCAAF